VPTALQLPADAHDTELRTTAGLALAPTGRVAATAVPHVPELSLTSKPCAAPELSVYAPTALQFPADVHDTELGETIWLVLAFAGTVALTAAPHVPELSPTSKPCVLFGLPV
jgi:hypothetical protein